MLVPKELSMEHTCRPQGAAPARNGGDACKRLHTHGHVSRHIMQRLEVEPLRGDYQAARLLNLHATAAFA